MARSAGQQAQIPPQPGPIAQHLQNGHQSISQISTPGTLPPSKTRFQWTGFTDKTLWDWLQLFVVPIIVVFITVWYTSQQSHDLQIARDQQLQAAASALDQQRQTTYDTYLDSMSELITSQKLRDSTPKDEVRVLARARTLAALRVLDPVRKGQLLGFLYDAHLIDNENDIVDLTNAYLSGADLRNMYLRGAYLSRAYLTGADLRGAYLRGANLNGAHLYGAKVTKEQLQQAYSLKGTIMPDGSTHPSKEKL